MVRQIQKVGGHFEPFFDEVSKVMSDDDSVFKVFVLSIIRLLVILVALGFVYAAARFIQMFVGKEIVKEEEIVIVHEYETEEEAEKARQEEAKKQR